MGEYIKREDVYEWLVAHLPKHQERIEQILNDVPSIDIDDDAVETPTNKVDTPTDTPTDLISRQAAIEALTGWQTDPTDEEIEHTLKALPTVTPTERNEEDILKFYYVESLDEYWIGQRCGTRYYGKWTGNCFTFTHSRYLPWGEHVVAPDTLWKEHTYPSEPKEIPFNEWLQGFLEKEALNGRPKGEWIEHIDDRNGRRYGECPSCHKTTLNAIEYDLNGERHIMDFCPKCGCDCRGNKE